MREEMMLRKKTEGLLEDTLQMLDYSVRIYSKG